MKCQPMKRPWQASSCLSFSRLGSFVFPPHLFCFSNPQGESVQRGSWSLDSRDPELRKTGQKEEKVGRKSPSCPLLCGSMVGGVERKL
jgi:hypothetical protein